MKTYPRECGVWPGFCCPASAGGRVLIRLICYFEPIIFFKTWVAKEAELPTQRASKLRFCKSERPKADHLMLPRKQSAKPSLSAAPQTLRFHSASISRARGPMPATVVRRAD